VAAAAIILPLFELFFFGVDFLLLDFDLSEPVLAFVVVLFAGFFALVLFVEPLEELLAVEVDLGLDLVLGLVVLLLLDFFVAMISSKRALLSKVWITRPRRGESPEPAAE
jgi:hypothetical protein